jgi:putative transposase
MARRLRIQYPGAIYHIINRGNYRRDLFATVGAAKSFECALAESCTRFGWQIHAFGTMQNHFHLALTTPVPNLDDGMHWLQTAFAVRFNRFRCESGHLFQGRYQSPLIQDSAALVRVVDYIHLNPARAGIVSASQALDFRWGSLGRFVRGPRPDWLSPNAWLGQLQLEDSSEGWAHYVERLEALAGSTESCEFDEIARGNPIGTDVWKKTLASEYQHRALEPDLPREETRALKEARWLAALEEAVKLSGKNRCELRSTAGLPSWKVEIASRVRKLSGAPFRWIAKALAIDSPTAIRVAVWRLCNM